jgi:hypothetical protein
MKWLSGAVVLVAAAHFLNLLASSRLFTKFAFGDNGWALTTDALLDAGLQPVTDFGYFYGLLTLMIDRALFAIFGRTPDVTIGLYAVCTLGVAVGMARTMASAKLRLMPALFLISCAALAAIPRGFPSPAHALEAALLMLALSEQAAGRLDRALLLTVLAVFIKPSLGYVLGLILVAMILRQPNRWKLLRPAAFVGAVIAAILAYRFSPEALIRTQLPFDAMKAYENAGFGFLTGSGQRFWRPVGADFNYYFYGVPGIWLISSLVLFLSAVPALIRWREPWAAFVLTCVVLHATFVFVMFGNEWSWIYYTYLLFTGAAVGLNAWPRWLGNASALLLIVASYNGQAEWLWRRDCSTRMMTGYWEETANLNAPLETAREWSEVRKIAAGYPGQPEKVLVLSRMGCPQFLAPELDGPHWWCLLEGFTSEPELERARDQIRKAEWIASPDWHDNYLMKWPEFAEVLRPFEEVAITIELDGARLPVRGFKIYRRRPQ